MWPEVDFAFGVSLSIGNTLMQHPGRLTDTDFGGHKDTRGKSCSGSEGANGVSRIFKGPGFVTYSTHVDRLLRPINVNGAMF